MPDPSHARPTAVAAKPCEAPIGSHDGQRLRRSLSPQQHCLIQRLAAEQRSNLLRQGRQIDTLTATETVHRTPAAAEEGYVGEIEDFGEEAFVPLLRRPVPIKEWAQFLEHARRVDAVRAWGYTC